jgi:SAM-dependent methyltransferase
MIGRMLRGRVNSSRVWLDRCNREFASDIPPGSLVLDAAAGGQPYRKLFDHARYESADFEKADKKYGITTYVCDLRSIPVEGDRFDYIIFNQALEHMPEPVEVLVELHRVLKPGGRMICTAPLFYEEHEQPYDFFRYTQYAYRHMFPKAGLQIERLDWMEGYFGTVAYQLETAAKYLPGGLLLWPLKIAFALLALLFYRWDIGHRYTGSGYPKNYVVIATKPASVPMPAARA